MKSLITCACLVFAFALPTTVSAQVPVVAQPKHELLLAAADVRLTANKRLVYDFWREVLEGGHMELADKYLAESYIQHNPNVATGRTGFVEAFSIWVKPNPIEAKVKAQLVGHIERIAL